MLTFDQMKELIDLVATRDLGGLEVRSGDFHFRVSGIGEPLAPAAIDRPATAAPAAVVAGGTPLAASAPEPPPEPEGYILTSPIVGTFYRSPSPEADPYVQPGDRVEKGEVLCIVEAMKLMNEIESDVSGTIIEVLAENSHPVEFGERLFAIRTDD